MLPLLSGHQIFYRCRRFLKKVYKNFFVKLGRRDLNNRDYEQFFRTMGTEEMKKLGLDPDEIRIKLDQIMEWNELPTEKKTPNKRYLEVDKSEK